MTPRMPALRLRETASGGRGYMPRPAPHAERPPRRADGEGGARRGVPAAAAAGRAPAAVDAGAARLGGSLQASGHLRPLAQGPDGPERNLGNRRLSPAVRRLLLPGRRKLRPALP